MPNDPVDVAAGAPNPEGYTDNGDGTVTDKLTGLMWQQTVPTMAYTWSGAVAYCSSVNLDSHTDWRLPTVVELVSIVDYSVASPSPAINSTAFPGTPTALDFFWSSTPVAGSASNAWGIDTAGAVTIQDVSGAFYVRCVR